MPKVEIDADVLQALVRAASLAVRMEDALEDWREEMAMHMPTARMRRERPVLIREIAQDVQRAIDSARRPGGPRGAWYDAPLTATEAGVLQGLMSHEQVGIDAAKTGPVASLRERDLIELGAVSTVVNWPGARKPEATPQLYHMVRVTARGRAALAVFGAAALPPPPDPSLPSDQQQRRLGYPDIEVGRFRARLGALPAPAPLDQPGVNEEDGA